MHTLSLLSPKISKIFNDRFKVVAINHLFCCSMILAVSRIVREREFLFDRAMCIGNYRLIYAYSVSTENQLNRLGRSS